MTDPEFLGKTVIFFGGRITLAMCKKMVGVIFLSPGIGSVQVPGAGRFVAAGVLPPDPARLDEGNTYQITRPTTSPRIEKVFRKYETYKRAGKKYYFYPLHPANFSALFVAS